MKVSFAVVPKQNDSWSCGHRVLLHLEAMFAQGFATQIDDAWAVKMSELNITKDDVNVEKIVALCKSWNDSIAAPKPPLKFAKAKLEEVLPFNGVIKKERALATATNPNIPLPRPVPTPARSVKSDPVVPVNPEPARAAATPTNFEPAGAKSSKVPEGGRSEKELVVSDKPRSGVEMFDEAFESRLAAFRDARKPDLDLRKSRDCAKKILRLCGLDFNSHFQKRHLQKLQKGHWHSFLDAVMVSGEDESRSTPTSSSVSCRVCQQLLIDFNIPKAKDQHDLIQTNLRKEATKPTVNPPGECPHSVQDAPALPVPDPPTSETNPSLEGQLAEMMDRFDEDQGEAAATEVSEPPRKKRRGRPCKGTEPTFNVVEFIASQRIGQYHLLTSEEARLFSVVALIVVYITLYCYRVGKKRVFLVYMSKCIYIYIYVYYLTVLIDYMSRCLYLPFFGQ